MKKEINFRKMQVEDIPCVAELEQRSFHDAWTADMLGDELEMSLTHYLLMEQEGQLLGYAGYWLVAGEAQITRVAVFPEQRGQGLGIVLTQELLKDAFGLGAEAVTLEVRESNIPAQKTYEHVGFKNAGIRPHYYENRENAIIMWLYK